MASSLVFSVRRHDPVLVTPAKPTPHEFKLLSDVDDQQGLRFKMSMIHFFGHSPSRRGHDPGKVVKTALSKALVFYYPLAGRLREGPNGKLVVECNAEGIVLVEADADVRLDQFGYLPRPPFPCEKELIYDVEGSAGAITGGPLFLIQVTRLKCGGFILAVRFNHVIADGLGLLQFLEAVTEMARGFDAPTVQPVWARELLVAPDKEHQQLTSTDSELTSTPVRLQPAEEDLVHRYFFFRPRDISALRTLVAPHLRGGSSSRFELLMALIWRSRSIALFSDVPDEQVCAAFHVNGRGRSSPPSLPKGYYGNAFAVGVARSTAGELSSQPLDYAVELVRRAKTSATLADFLEGRLCVTLADLDVPFRVGRTYLVSDVSSVAYNKLDLGWGKPVYSGPVVLATWSAAGGHSKFVRCWNREGLEGGVVAPVCLPRMAMERFVAEMESIVKVPTAEEMESSLYSSVPSKL
ncbi:10-deacetylbaccatin III 10-O-acetyltransferase [Iris pallida]|uniref:10-deacetylbaccatin III 10-O-acetyltransferase n=1 Tax=Iris pallida TaxID=29817 RepID=A0AAX6F9F7_IRIPA|nr:10-deacetylbaccatin III 10-O-acetyltransferase [Iris pallida]